jgi:hypothetical protein
VGALTVVLASYAMWAVLVLYTTGEFRHLVSATVPALFTLVVLGPVLIPVGAIAALAIRFLQVRLTQVATVLPPSETPAPIEVPVSSEVPVQTQPAGYRSRLGSVGAALKWVGIVFAGGLAIGMLGLLVFGYLIIHGDTVQFSSTSPSGRLTFHTREGCLGHACFHDGRLERHSGWFSSTSVPCRLGFRADFPFFGTGASAYWNEDETIVSWTSSQGYKGQVDVRKDCGPKGE